MATRAEISYSYLAAIENGTKPASTKVQVKIAEALGVRVHELFAAAEARHEVHPQRGQRWRQLMEGARFAGDDSVEPSAVARSVPYRTAPQQSPRTELGALSELRSLLPHLGDDDIEILLQLARKLAGRGA